MKPNVLDVTLPEDISRVKAAGDFQLALQMIDYRLNKELPERLRERLLYEKDVLARIDEDFIYSKEEALTILKENIKDFTDEEFTQLFNEGAFEFYYINGEMKFNARFLMNLTKTRKAYRDRSKEAFSSQYLDDVISELKAKGEKKIRYTVHTTIKVNSEALKDNQKLKVWVPVPIEAAQISDVKILKTSQGLISINEPNHPARAAYFEAKGMDTFSVEYSFVNHCVYHSPKEEEVLAYSKDMSEFLKEQKPHIIFTDYLKSIVKEVIKDETNPLAKARKIYSYITSHIMYSFMRPYLTLPIISEYAATSLKGDCGVQALLFITMCRIAGVPTKWQSGLYIDENGENGSHDWAMFYVEPYGWLFADCSFGGSAHRNGASEREEFYFGNLDPYRIVQATDFQADLSPEPTFTRKDPYDNQTGEAEYENEPLSPKYYQTTSKIIKIEEL